MQLGNQNLTTGDIRRYQIDYTPFLQPGEVLSTFTLAIAAQLPPATHQKTMPPPGLQRGV